MPAEPALSHTATLNGVIALLTLGLGSKSERAAVALVDDAGRPHVLRRAGGPALGDPELMAWLGQRMTLRGQQRATYFLVMDATAGTEPAAPGSRNMPG